MRIGINIAVFGFWATAFAGLAHASLSAAVPASSDPATAQYDALIASLNGHLAMTAMLLVVAALFVWAALSAAIGQGRDFSEVETFAYAGGVMAMGVAVIVGFAKLAVLLLVPAVLTATLAVSAAASVRLRESPTEAPAVDMVRLAARRMAIGAAHNSLLSRIGPHGAGSGGHRR